MNDNDFLTAVAEAIEDTHLMVLADDDAVTLSYGFPTDTITVRTGDGDVFTLSVNREGRS